MIHTGSDATRLGLPLYVMAVVVASICSVGLALQASDAPPAEEPAPEAVPLASLGCTQRFVEAPNGVRLAVKELGDPDHPAIVLIHGFSQSHLSWKRQFEELAGAGFRVVAWDYPGHGDSDRPADLEAYARPETWAGYLQAILADLAVEKACLVGHSLGGVIVEDYIFVHGVEAVSGVVYAAGTHRLDLGLAPNFAEALAVVGRIVAPELSVRLQATEEFTRLLTHHPLSAEEALEVAMYNSAVAREVIGGLFAYMRAEKPEGHDDQLLASLASLPVLFVHGAEDAIVKPEATEASIRLIREAGGESADVELVALSDVGHSPQLEAAGEFNRRVAEFCGRSGKGR